MNSKIKIVFFGTPKFSEIVLRKLMQSDFEIAAVVTAPDKAVGRKKVMTPPVVKVLAEKNNIPVLQPVKLDEDFINKLTHSTSSGQEQFKADLFVVASYGKIIPQSVLDLPKHGNINVHPSLLPKYRGASPIQSALLNGDEKTGVTIMLMDEKMDHGDIIFNFQFPISNDMTFPELHDKLAELGAELLIKTISDYVAGKIKPVEQKHEQATFCKMIKKEDGEIDWQQPAEKIYNQWRAFCEWPGIYKNIKIQENKNIKIKFIEFVGTGLDLSDKNPGEFFIPADSAGKQDKKLFIACGNNTILEIKKLQPEGKKTMDAQSFINGYLK